MTALPADLAQAEWLRAAPLQRVFAAIGAAGGEARVAGGAVRNGLIGEPIADIDIATTLDPQAVMRAGAAAGFSVHPTGIAHGTVTLVADHQPFEVTSLRVDVATDGRRATVAFTSDWEQDAARRDFTINALYCDAGGRIHDTVGGLADLAARRVRFVGDPEARITEDTLRILRFFRFEARYGRGEPDAQGLAAAVKLKAGLARLSAERVRQELLKLVAAPRALPVLGIMHRAGILAEVLPEPRGPDLFARLAAIEERQGRAPDPLLRLASLTSAPGELRRRLRLSNRESQRISALGRAATVSPALRPPERRAMLYRIGGEAFGDAALMGWAEAGEAPDDPARAALLALPALWTAPRFPLDGARLIAHGVPPGPALGAALSALEDRWIASDFSLEAPALLALIPAPPTDTDPPPQETTP